MYMINCIYIYYIIIYICFIVFYCLWSPGSQVQVSFLLAWCMGLNMFEAFLSTTFGTMSPNDYEYFSLWGWNRQQDVKV